MIKKLLVEKETYREEYRFYILKGDRVLKVKLSPTYKSERRTVNKRTGAPLKRPVVEVVDNNLISASVHELKYFYPSFILSIDMHEDCVSKGFKWSPEEEKEIYQLELHLNEENILKVASIISGREYTQIEYVDELIPDDKEIEKTLEKQRIEAVKITIKKLDKYIDDRKKAYELLHWNRIKKEIDETCEFLKKFKDYHNMKGEN